MPDVSMAGDRDALAMGATDDDRRPQLETELLAMDMVSATSSVCDERRDNVAQVSLAASEGAAAPAAPVDSCSTASALLWRALLEYTTKMTTTTRAKRAIAPTTAPTTPPEPKAPDDVDAPAPDTGAVSW